MLKSCFPTLIYYDVLNKNKTRQQKLIKDVLAECFRFAAVDEEGKEWSQENFKGGYTSYSSHSRLDQLSSTFASVKQLIDKHVINFAKSLEWDANLKELQMSSCWMNIVPNGCFHSLHLHPLSVISGTLYLQTPRHCGKLRLEDPRMARFMAAPAKLPGASFKNQSQLYFTPSVGKIVLFESWLRHEVEVSQATSDRVSISFNYSI